MRVGGVWNDQVRGRDWGGPCCPQPLEGKKESIKGRYHLVTVLSLPHRAWSSVGFRDNIGVSGREKAVCCHSRGRMDQTQDYRFHRYIGYIYTMLISHWITDPPGLHTCQETLCPLTYMLHRTHKC